MQQEMEYIYEVFREKNFTHAAEKLFITQPALSMAIQKVEERLGMPLFDRSTRPLSVTEAGEAYLKYILRVRQLETELEQQIQDIRELETGRITLGGSNYINTCILPPVLAGFASRYPGIEINLIETSSADLSEKLKRQEIDITFHCSPEFIQHFERYAAFQDRILLAVPQSTAISKDCPEVSGAALSAKDILANRHLKEDCPAVPLEHFRDLSYILLTKGNNLYERSRQMFEEAGFVPNTVMKLSQLATAYHLSNAGIGATFVSDRLVSVYRCSLNYYKLDSPLATRQFFILLPDRKYVSVALQRFIDYFQSCYG
ncbi:MAG: LysR family transcriptional regulator [Lachnospiraceae bacterium]|nr:LysR family transcriptional regulator [Lachnospiraceae bacterium]